MTDDLSRTKAGLCSEIAAAEKSRDAEKTIVERLKPELANEIERSRQRSVERLEISRTASHPLAEVEDFLRDMRLEVAAITAERNG